MPYAKIHLIMRIGINKKIIGLFSLGVILFAIFVASSFLVIKELHKTLQEANVVSVKVNTTGALQFQVNKLLLPTNQYLLTGDVSVRDNFDKIVNEMAGFFANLRAFNDDTKWAELSEKIEKDAIDFVGKAVEILYIDNPVDNKEAQQLMADLNIKGDILVKEVDEFHRIAQNEMSTMEKKADNISKNSRIITIIVLLIAITFVWLLYYYTRRFVTVPILKLYEGAGIIAKGNLDYRLNINTGDEFEDLASEFNVMTTSLGETKKELDRRILELFTLYNISKVLSSSFEVEELLNRLVTNVSNSINIDRVAVMLIDDVAKELYITSHTDFKGIDLENKRFKLGKGFYGRLAVTGEAMIIKEVDKNPTITLDEKLDTEINSIISVPFGARGGILGLLNVYKNKPDIFNEKDMDLLKAVAEQVAIALENARLYKETKIMSITDGLTGLYNHKFFIEKLDLEVTRAKRYNHTLSLIMIDIDYFKSYNDTHGHQAGDSVIKLVATLVKKNLRGTDIMARYGGEEFVIILPETDKAGAAVMAERIRRYIEEYPFPYQETQPTENLTISMGVSLLDKDINADTLIKIADDALYKAKNKGRNRVVAE